MVILHKKPAEPKKITLHGHTVIELKDVRTGKRERIEHDNEFTGALDEALANNGHWLQAPWSDATWASVPIYQRLLGGVYIFKNTISKVAGKYPYYMPASNKMVANGSFGEANASLASEMGTYSSSDSYFNDNTLCFVYDWTTSQGNGTFQCVCLGSDVGGYIGYGNAKSLNSKTPLKSIGENQSDSTSYDLILTNGNYGYNRQAKITANSHLVLTKTKDVFSKYVDLFPHVQADIDVEIPTNKIAANVEKRCRMIDEGKIAVFPATIAANDTGNLGIYDIAHSTWEWHSIVAPTALTMEANSEMSPEGFCYVDSSTKMFIDLSNDTSAQANISALTKPLFKFAEDLWMSDGYIYNAYEDKLYPCNGKKFIPTTANTFNGNLAIGDNIRNFTHHSTSFVNYMRQIHNPMYLATVNNLSESIEKNNSSAMKLTYTITREA